MSGQHLINCEMSTKISIYQVGSITNGNAADNTLDKAGYCSQNSVYDSSVKSSKQLPGANGSLHVEASDCKSHKRLKKKILRRQVVTMHFRSSLFLRATLALRKKKKYKRSKRKPLDTKNLSKELLLASNCFPSDFGPSTSEMTQTISTGSAPQKKEAKSGIEANGTVTKDGISSRGYSLKNVLDAEFEERIGQNGSVQTQSGFGSSMNQLDARRKNGSRGLEETVGEWFIWNLFSSSGLIIIIVYRSLFLNHLHGADANTLVLKYIFCVLPHTHTQTCFFWTMCTRHMY